MISALPRLWTPRRMLNEFRLTGELDRVTVEIKSGVGFFAQLNWCLYILAYCDDHQLRPRIRLTGSNYARAPHWDWFHDFFVETGEHELQNDVRITPVENRQTTLHLQHINETNFANTYAPSMTIEKAHRLFTAYFRVRPEIQDYVREFAATAFAKAGTVGLHFRGTDKATEAKPVEWSQCLRSVSKYVADHPEVTRVFISSDDSLFVEWFSREAKGMATVVSHADDERSRNSRPVHTNPAGNGYRKGFEALVNCLLLSRCTALIRTSSFLSGWSSVFNPRLPITLLNEPYEQTRWFPDRELIRRSDNRYR